jgi:nitroimidazol reductase NimA-like FMN-containing flavoprotein (pyridoxamine 5'-phosphate oxidase superfamily)
MLTALCGLRGRTMRHPEREMKDRETITALLRRSPVGRVATVNGKGFPVIKPVNFIYWDGKIFIHSSMKGEKIRDIRRGSPVCFEIDEPITYIATRGGACAASYLFRSIIIKGKATFINGHAEKRKILRIMMEKYQPEGGYGPISEEILKKTAVIGISVDEMTGKERLG